MIVLAGASGRTLAFGPGHTLGTALPGERGTSIVSGHRDTHFAVLEELRRGDEIAIERSDGRIVYYEVEELQVADARTMRIGIAAEEDALVLVTCWPFDAVVPGGPLRYVVTTRVGSRHHSGGVGEGYTRAFNPPNLPHRPILSSRQFSRS